MVAPEKAMKSALRAFEQSASSHCVVS